MTTDEQPIISIRSITKQFPGVTALADVTLDVRAGELHAICGENGAGKSTLMKILSGVITDYDGELLLADRAVRFKGTRDAEAAGISIIHQELNLVEQLSAAANIFLGREIRGWLVLRDDRAMEQVAAAERAGVRHSSTANCGRIARRRPAAHRDRQGPLAAKRHPDHG
jgi:ABC-type sugar transport system ATPase subunit